MNGCTASLALDLLSERTDFPGFLSKARTFMGFCQKCFLAAMAKKNALLINKATCSYDAAE